jgi:chromosome segregation ATPase
MAHESVAAPLDISDDHDGINQPSAGNCPLNEATENAPTTMNSDAEGASDIGAQANLLLNLIGELRTITDRACNAAFREAECATQIEENKETEVNELRDQLKAKDESLQDREAAFRELEESWQAKIGELNSQLREQDSHLDIRETELKHLRSEIDCLLNRLNQAELGAKEAESKFQSLEQRLEAQVAELSQQLNEQEEHLRAKEIALRRLDVDHAGTIKDLQGRLQNTERELINRETEMKEKECLIQAAAAKEAEIGKLIQRLSSECQKLSRELHEKSALITQLEKRGRRAAGEGTGWKKVLGLAHEQPL